MGTVLPAMQPLPRRVLAAVRGWSPILLIWVASLTLGVADVVYARLLPGPVGVLDVTALALACAAGAVFCVAAGVAFDQWRRTRVATTTGDDLIAREAQWGIAQIEAWLAREDHSRDG